MKRLLSAVGLWAVLGAFVFGAGWAVVSPAPPAHATDTATFLGVIEVDCRAGRLVPQTIVFTGGVGDTFKLLSSAANCTIPTTTVLDGEPGSLVAGTVSTAITVVSAGDFIIEDAATPTRNSVTFKTVAGPVFANLGPIPRREISFSCNITEPQNRTIEFRSIGEEITLYNSSGSRACGTFTGIGARFDGDVPTTDLGTERSSNVLTVKAAGTFTVVARDGNIITFTVVQNADLQGDIGSGLAVNGAVTYTDVFYSVATGVVDARVTLVGTTNLEGGVLDVLDENLAPDGGNWALAPTIDIDTSGVEGSATVRIDFFQTGTTTAVELTNLSATVVDIDNSQFVSVPDVTTFNRSSTPPTVLSASRSGNVLRVNDPLGEGSSDSDQENWVVLNFDRASSLQFTFGGFFSGPSFAVAFAPAPWSATPVTTAPSTLSDSSTLSGGSTEAEASNQQGIHLDLRASPGARVDATSALMEGQGLLPSSTYALRLGPGGQSLKNGQVSSGGRFSHEIRLPSGLAPGKYFVELSATGRNGANLVLHQSFTVGPGGVLTLVSSAKPGSSFQGSLAATGPDAAVSMSLSAAAALLVLGLVALVLSRSRRFLGAK